MPQSKQLNTNADFCPRAVSSCSIFHRLLFAAFFIVASIPDLRADTKLYGLSIKDITVKPLGSGLVSVASRSDEIVKSEEDAKLWVASQAFQSGLFVTQPSPIDVAHFISSADEAQDYQVASLGLVYLTTMQSARSDWLLAAEKLNAISDKSKALFQNSQNLLRKISQGSAAPLLVALKLPYPAGLEPSILEEFHTRLTAANADTLEEEIQASWEMDRSDASRQVLNKSRELLNKVTEETLSEASLPELVAAINQQPWSADFLYPVLQQRLFSLMDRGVFSGQESIMLFLSWPQERITPDLKNRTEELFQRDSLDYHWLTKLSSDQQRQLLTSGAVSKIIVTDVLERSFKKAVIEKDFSTCEILLGYLLQLRPDPSPVNDRLRFLLAQSFFKAGYERFGNETINKIQTGLTFTEQLWLNRFTISIFSLTLLIIVLLGIIISRRLRQTPEDKKAKSTVTTLQQEPLETAAPRNPGSISSMAAEAGEEKGEAADQPKQSFVQLDPNRHLAALRLEYEGHLKVLGVDPGATLGEIKRAFRDRMKDLHPDMQITGDSTASNTFIAVNKSYEQALAIRKHLFPD